MAASSLPLLLCLVGRHGSGKSSIGRRLAEKHGWQHISPGSLGRLARARKILPGVPMPLIMSMGQIRPGEPLRNACARRLLEYASTFDVCVLDGFPAVCAHVSFMPAGAVIFVVVSPKKVRTELLLKRAGMTLRKWTEGRPSLRDEALSGMLSRLRESHRVFVVRNADSDDGADAAVRQIEDILIRQGLEVPGMGESGT